MLQQICKTVRDEFVSAVYTSAIKRWSAASVRHVLKDALEQCSKIDSEMIKIAFSDLDEKIDEDGQINKTKVLSQV
jgi:hypothetical protein